VGSSMDGVTPAVKPVLGHSLHTALTVSPMLTRQKTHLNVFAMKTGMELPAGIGEWDVLTSAIYAQDRWIQIACVVSQEPTVM